MGYNTRNILCNLTEDIRKSGGGDITVVANPEGAATADLTKLQVGSGIYGVSNVKANVAVSTLAAPLTSLKVNDDEYVIESGGSTVEANPTGTATADLEKLKVGSTIYGIPGVENYSTSEIVVGSWLGETLYRRVIDTGSLPDTTNNDVSVPALVNCNIVKLYGVAHATSNYVTIPLPFVTTGESTAYVQLMAFTATNNAGVRITTGDDRTAFDESYVVVEYTKPSV